jgi:glycosyltransferase involved in cell wall biosynthesis
MAILRHLDTGKVAPRVILPSRGPLADAMASVGVELHILPWLERARSKSYRKRLLTAFRLSRWLRRHGIDIAHLNMWHNMDGGVFWLAAKLARARFVVGIRTQLTYVSPYERMWLSHTDQIVAVSRAGVAAALKRRRFDRFWHVDPQKIVIIPPGRDLRELRTTAAAPKAVLAEIGLRSGEELVGMVGAIHRYKQPDMFVKMAALLAATRPTLQFVIVGDSYQSHSSESVAYVENIKRLVRDLGLSGRLVFAGYRSDAIALMRHFRVLVHPSLSEGLGGTLIEAMALGVPVVAAAVGGIPELVEDQVTGTLIRSLDPAEYAAAVVGYLDDRDSVERVTAAAKISVQRCDAKNVTRMLEDCYGRLR